jgi:dephospho-CoA kinase
MATVIGVTGGIGCGKTTVASIISEILSAPILDADKISREAMKSKEILTNICNFFSKDIFDEDGNIDRKKISSLAFSDEDKLRKLNAIIHPFVMKQIKEQIEKFSNSNKYIVVDVPLPNKDFTDICNYIITVSADENTRIKRVMDRSKLTQEEISARMKKQMPQSEYEALANSVIYNNENLAKLKLDVISLLNDQKFLI